MVMKKKIRKPYERPLVKEVRLEVEEAVLAACKSTPTDSSGKNAKVCGTQACKNTFGS
jgi:hypothetical protein